MYHFMRTILCNIIVNTVMLLVGSDDLESLRAGDLQQHQHKAVRSP